MHHRWLTLTEAAKRLGINRSSVFMWVQRGKLPAAQTGPRHIIMIRDDELEKFARERTKNNAGRHPTESSPDLR